MKKTFFWVAASLLVFVGLVQEIGYGRSRASKVVGGEDNSAQGLGSRVKHGSSSLLPTLSGLIMERRKDFESLVFGPIKAKEADANDPATAVVAQATGNDPDKVLFARHSHVESVGQVVMLIVPEASSSGCQKFVIKLATGDLVLVNHNIEKAPPVEDLKLGDTVAFAGEYTTGLNGDEVTKTYADPTGAGQAGWIRHNGRVYH